MSNIKLGLALAGGGSLGAYQVGVLKRLKEKGYHFDVVTGTSVGAINGCLVCMDDIDSLEKLWLEISPEKVMKDGVNLNKDFRIDFEDPNILSFLKNYAQNKGADITPFKELCKAHIFPKEILKSKIKFGTICVSVPLLQEVKVDMHTLDEDHILPFVHASSACFPVFPIEEIDNKKYVDGFYRNNLPIDFCFELGAEKIIAIDLGMFGLKPQNSFLMSLPNVEVIKPKCDLGSFMDFSHEVIVKNMKRGYNDAKKYLHELRGYKYSFEKSEDLEKYAALFIELLIKNINRNAKRTIEYLYNEVKDKNFPLSDNTSFLILALESLGESYELDDTIVYNHKDFFKLISKAAIKHESSPLSIFDSAKNKLSKMYQKLVNKDEEPSNFTRNDEILNIFYILAEVYKKDIKLLK